MFTTLTVPAAEAAFSRVVNHRDAVAATYARVAARPIEDAADAHALAEVGMMLDAAENAYFDALFNVLLAVSERDRDYIVSDAD